MAGIPESPNLIGTPLDSKIIEQLKQRSQLLSQTGTRSDENLLALANKNCWVRLSSFVSVDASGIPDIKAGTGGEVSVQGGTYLAEQWALRAEQRDAAGLKYGVNSLVGAYGSGGKGEIGYRPMPGIVGVSIESQPPLGAIRSAVVKIKAWNLNQLSMIDILYFRLGFTMLLEWGHSVFLDNKGKLVTAPIPIDVFSKAGQALTKEDVLSQLAKKRQDYSYNYDGSLGVVTNYSWTQNGDGSYDCTLNLVGLGSVVESLKINTQDSMPDITTPSTVTTTQVTTPDDSSLLGFLTAVENQPAGQLDFNKIFSKGSDLLNKPTDAFTYGYNTSYMGLPTGATIPSTVPKVNLTDLGVRYSPALIELSGNQAAAPKKQTYIKLGMLLAYLNNSCLLYEKNKPFVPIDFNPDTNFCLRMPQQFSIDPQVCLVDMDCSDADYSNLLTVKAKSTKALGTPKSPANGTIASGITTTSGGYIDKTAGKSYRGKFMNIYVNTTCIRATVAECTDKEKNVFMSNFLSTLMRKIQVALGNINNYKIGFDETANTCYIYDAQLVDQENLKAAIPTLPVFGLQSIVREFNLKSEASTKIGSMLAITARAGARNTGQNSDAAAFTVLNRSLYDRLLPDLATTPNAALITAYNQQQATQNAFVSGLAANQAPTGTQLLTGQNITNQTTATPPPTPAATTSDTDGVEALAANFNAQVRNLYGLDTAGFVIRYDKQGIEAIKNYYIDTILRIKGKLDPTTGQGDSVAATGVLPLALNLTVDGIGGIPLLQAFTLPANRLPVQYTKDGQPRIAFTIAGLNHTIENNQWTTAIRGLMFNIPSGSRTYTPNYQAKQNTTSGAPTPTLTGGTVSGDYIPLAQLKPATQQAINQGLVLVREAATQQRTVGTMWYKGQVLGFVVEDALRTTKVDDQTAVPAGTYAITLDTTSRPKLKKYYVKFPGEKGKLASPGVFARVGNPPSAVNLSGPPNFSGIRIHGGVSENSSSGCLIYSSKRNKNGTVVDDINHNFALTRLIYKDKIKQITIINEFA